MSSTSLVCFHDEGRDQLLDGLEDGTLSSKEQQALAALLSPLQHVSIDFDSDEIHDYEAESLGDGNYIETWTCPACFALRRETVWLGGDD